MNEVGALLACVLDRPDDLTALLVLADSVEEQADPDGPARAELLRLRAQWAGAAENSSARRKADRRASAILKERSALIGPLRPLLPHEFLPLGSPSLALFLAADYAPAAGDPWTPDTSAAESSEAPRPAVRGYLPTRYRSSRSLEAGIVTSSRASGT